MQITWRLALVAFMLVGCASHPGDGAVAVAPSTPLRGGVAEFKPTSYNGEILLGRLLLGATLDTFVLDGNLYEWVDIELKNVRVCGGSERLKHWVYEALPPPPTPEQVVTLRAGYWYGEDVHFVLFDKVKTGVGPDCLEGELVVRALDRRVVARVAIRVPRTDKGHGEEATPPARE